MCRNSHRPRMSALDDEVSALRSAQITSLAPPPWLSEKIWPFKTFTLDIGGTSIAFTDVGHGPTLLFVHVGLWSFIWRDVLALLSRRFRCICLDAPGNGQSGRPKGPINLELAAGAVAALIDQLELNELSLVIHDLGGLSGVVGAARSAATIKGIVAVNAFAWHPSGTALRAMLRIVGSRAVREIDVVTKIVPRVTATEFGVGRCMDQPSRRAFGVPLGTEGIRAFHDYLHDALRCDALHAEASRAIETHFACVPMMTIFGERNDPFHFQEEWLRRFPGAQQLVIPRGNHFPMCDDPAGVARAIERWQIANGEFG
jgi:pimeloyl-ACP methyl ester carboxylesterase